MKTTTFLRTLLAITAMGAALTTISCGTKDDPKPVKPKPTPTKLIEVVYKINTAAKDIKLTSLIVTSSKGADSTITKDLKFPMEVKLKRPVPAKNSVIKIKTKVDKPAKVDLEILVDGKSAKKQEANITDIKNEGVVEHKF